MPSDRRSLLKYAALTPLAGAFAPLTRGAESATDAKADYTLRIARGRVELAPRHTVSTTLYSGVFPGPLQRFTEDKRAIVDIYNDTDIPQVAHWHGQILPSDVDGAIEEGTPAIPPHGMRRISFVPKPAGFRFLHTHVIEATTGVMKDVVMLGGFQDAEVDFVADNPGLTLFHCRQQLHMDFGFMALFKYA